MNISLTFWSMKYEPQFNGVVAAEVCSSPVEFPLDARICWFVLTLSALLAGVLVWGF